MEKINKLLNKKHQRTESQTTPSDKPEQSQFYIDEITEDPQIAQDEEELGLETTLDKDIPTTNKSWINKQRTLVVASRGISHQERYLVNDIISLLPHSKKECKIQKNLAKEELTEICFNHNCKNALYFEHRKRELVMWMFRAPGGPCAKFQVRNIHTLNEIKLSGNCLKYSRPLLSFDKSFDDQPHMKLLKELFKHAFNSPKNHPKTKPFYDHLICFYNVNNNIFFKNYQILNELKEKFCEGDSIDKLQLSEIGPRFSLNLIRIFDGSMGGKTLYNNPTYVAPSVLVKRNTMKFKERKLKDDRQKEIVNEKIKNRKDSGHNWLDDEQN